MDSLLPAGFAAFGGFVLGYFIAIMQSTKAKRLIVVRTPHCSPDTMRYIHQYADPIAQQVGAVVLVLDHDAQIDLL